MNNTRRFFGDNFVLPPFIDNHDMNRFLWAAGGDKARLRLALGLLFALGGPPVLYYGTEVGLGQLAHGEDRLLLAINASAVPVTLLA